MKNHQQNIPILARIQPSRGSIPSGDTVVYGLICGIVNIST